MRIRKRLSDLLSKAKIVAGATYSTDWGTYVDEAQFKSWGTSTIHALTNYFGKSSPYYINFLKEFEKKNADSEHIFLNCKGILESAINDYNDGYLNSIRSLISADIFSSSIEQAKELLGKKYKDASAVIAGATLENSLRTLCEINQIEIKDKDDNIIENPKLDRMNSELTKHGVYNKLKQKSITTWADLRNKAAHGHYDQYSTEEVRLMILSIEDFLANHL